MDTRIATTQIRMQNWVEIIQDRNASGLTIDDYCKAHELSRNAYFYWLRKIRDAALESKGVSFTEVPLSDLQTEMAALDFQPKLTVQIGNAVVRINGDSCNIRTAFLNYPDKAPELPGQDS